jgi:hypothetical protein
MDGATAGGVGVPHHRIISWQLLMRRCESENVHGQMCQFMRVECSTG